MAKAIGYLKPDIDPNLRLHVPFNEGVGNVAKDYSQYGNHAQLTDVEWSPDGFNGAGKFNGTSAFGDCGSDASSNITDAITIVARVKQKANNQGYVVIKSTADDSKRLYSIYLDSTNAFIYFFYNDGTAQDINWGERIDDDIWHRIAITVSGTTGILYIDGTSKGTRTLTNPFQGDIATTLKIGKRDPSAFYFYGIIDEARIYALALSAAQNAADCYEVVCS